MEEGGDRLVCPFDEIKEATRLSIIALSEVLEPIPGKYSRTVI